MVASTRRSVLVKRGILRGQIIPGFFVDGVTENAVREGAPELARISYDVNRVRGDENGTAIQ